MMKSTKSRPWNPELSLERERAVATLVAELPKKISALKALRDALGLSQAELAKLLNTTQSNVSKIEAKDEVRLGSLRAAVEARGGRLRVVAAFPDREVELELPV